MKTFKQYLTEAEKEYKYTIRFIDECTEEMQEKTEHVLSKYDLKNISAPKKSMFHTNPAGFEQEAGEVYTMEATTGIALPMMVRDAIAQHCSCAEKDVTVSGLNDPFIEQEPQEFEKGEANLGNEEKAEAVKHEDFYGEDFKSKVVDEMIAAVKEREQHVSKYMKGE